MPPVTTISAASEAKDRRSQALAAEPVLGQWGAVLDIPATTRGIAAARRIVRVLLSVWALSDEICADAELVVSELVTNAFVHAPGTETFELEIVRLQNGVRVSLADGSSVHPMIREVSSEQPSGRGLRIVEALAAQWGSEDHHAGKRVWADLDSATPAAAETTNRSVMALVRTADG